MKLSKVTLAIALLVSCNGFSKPFKLANVGFAAPAINGTSNVYNPETGAIVFDQSAGGFYGYTTTSWIPLGSSSAVIPAGVVEAYAGSTVPTGYLPCDGAAVSRTTYAALFTAIGTTYGAGDGTTTFNVPNAQGVFLRGDGTQTVSGVSYSGTQGVTEGDQMQGHTHSINDPGHSHSSAALFNTNAIGGVNASGAQGYTSTGVSTTGITVQSPTTDGTNGTPRTGAETHPANISVKYIIKY